MSNSIKTLFYEKQDYSNIEFEKCKDGNLTFKNTKNGKGVYIHSKYNPIKEAQTFAEKLEFEKDSIIILFGFGLGHFIREILKKCSNRNIIVVYEPDNVLFSKVVDEGVCSDIFENNKVIVYSDSNVDNFGNFIKTLIKTNMYMRCKFFVTPTYEQLYHNECIKFFEHNKNMMSENIIRRNTIWDKSILWVKNPYENFETTLDSFSSSQMKNLFKGNTFS